LAKGVLTGMRQVSMNILNEQGVLRDDIVENMREMYVPWLFEQADRKTVDRNVL